MILMFFSINVFNVFSFNVFSINSGYHATKILMSTSKTLFDP